MSESMSWWYFFLTVLANLAPCYVPLGLKYIPFGWKWLVSRLEEARAKLKEARAKKRCSPCETAVPDDLRLPHQVKAEPWNPWIQSQMDESKLKK